MVRAQQAGVGMEWKNNMEKNLITEWVFNEKANIFRDATGKFFWYGVELFITSHAVNKEIA